MDRFRMLLRLAIAILVFGLTCVDSGVHMAAEGDNITVDQMEARRGGVYRVPLLNNPATLDPAYVRDIYGIGVVQQLFDGLVQFSPDLFVVPALAENWQVEDEGKTYRFFLRSNARFHDGRQVTSKDVVFSLSRLLRVDPPSTILPHLLKIIGARDYLEHNTEEVAGLQVIDDRTLLIRLVNTYVPFIVALGMHQAKIVPREVVERNAQKFGLEPVGSGPFKFVSWEENKRIRLQGFADYYAGRPLLDEIEYVVYPGIGIEGVWADFQLGKLDQMVVFGDVREKLKERKDLQWVHRPSLNVQFYGFNCRHPLLKNRDLRMALNMSMDRDRLVTDAYNGQFEVARGILPPGLPGYHPQELTSAEDVAGALALVKRTLGDTPLPVPIEIVSNSQSPLARAELEFVRKSWARLGIDLQPKFIPDWSQFKQYLKSDSLQIYRYAWFADIPDADDFLRSLFFSDSQFNFTRYQDTQVDEMLLKALEIVDPVERARMYQQIEKAILDSYSVNPIAHLSTDYVYQPTVQGIEENALGAHAMSFYHVWLKKPSQR